MRGQRLDHVVGIDWWEDISWQTAASTDRSSALAWKSKDPTTCWIQVFSAGETGVERVVVDEGDSWIEWSVGDTGGVAGDEADPHPNGQR
jgi:hypothetical protein